ncbi:hypothetical protein SEA_LEROY_78 [Gordonia phage Leroy]|nr:hypothetical protein SEA_LEROY_78 [Gordonia phage Leroy]
MSDIGFGPVGDPPIVNHYAHDDYGRVTQLVDRRLLEQAEVRIAEVGVFARSLLGDQVDGDTPGLDSESEGIVVAHSHLIGRRIQDIIDGKHSPIVVPESRNACSIVDDILERQDGEGSHNAARRVVAERDHWRAEAEKAHTPDASNPKDLRSVADLLERVINVRRSPNTCPDLRAAADRLESESTADEWCREESCRYRHWRSGDMPTHRRGEHCPPVTPEATADDVVEKVARVPHAVHNHGSEDGPGLACNEVRLTDGRKLGVCLLPHLRGDR